jgi:hypothetical protein
MDWLKDLSDLGAGGLMLVGLIYVVRHLGNHLSLVSETLQNLVSVTSEMKAKVDECPHRHKVL